MTIKPGALRFNTDSMKLEIFRGSANYEGSASMAGIGTLAAGQWEEIQATSPDVQTGGTRGLFVGGNAYPSSLILLIILILITTGNAIDFGNLTGGIRMRSWWTFKQNKEYLVVVILSLHIIILLTFVTISSTGNAQDFGDLLADSNKILLDLQIKQVEYLLVEKAPAGG